MLPKSNGTKAIVLRAENKTRKVKHTMINYVTKTVETTRTVVDRKAVNVGVEYKSATSDRGLRITPSSSMTGRFAVTVSNPDGDNELAVILKKEDLIAFLRKALDVAVNA